MSSSVSNYLDASGMKPVMYFELFKLRAEAIPIDPPDHSVYRELRTIKVIIRV